MTRKAVALAALMLSYPTLAGAAGPEAPPPESPASRAPAAAAPDTRTKREERTWFALPVLFWLPETKLGFGAAGGFHFHIQHAERASSVFVVGAYTMQRQGSADTAAELYLPSGIFLAGRVRAVHFPDSFYGIGPDSLTESRERFTRRFAEAVLNGEYPIVRGRLRAGVRLDIRGEELQDLQAGGVLASGALEGTAGFGAIGIGGSITWDTRDKPLYPSRGSYAQAWVLGYPGAIGGGHETFVRGSLEGRTFLPIGRRRVLGAAAFIDQVSENTPITLFPKLGSVRFLRGFREGRFRDRLAWAAQTELRFPFADRFFGAVFGAVGDVGKNIRSLRADTLKVAGGVGVRFRLTDAGANIRLDVAASKDGPEVYLILLEAF